MPRVARINMYGKCLRETTILSFKKSSRSNKKIEAIPNLKDTSVKGSSSLNTAFVETNEMPQKVIESRA